MKFEQWPHKSCRECVFFFAFFAECAGMKWYERVQAWVPILFFVFVGVTLGEMIFKNIIQ